MLEEYQNIGLYEIVGCCCACQMAKDQHEKAEYQLQQLITKNKELAHIPSHYLTADIATVQNEKVRKLGTSYINRFQEMERNRRTWLFLQQS